MAGLLGLLCAAPFNGVSLMDSASAVVLRQDVTPQAALSDPSLSPDGRELAFVAGGDIWTVPAEGGVARLLVSHPATESRPLYSPDGKQLAFVSTRTGGGDIYVLDLTTGVLHRRTFEDGREQLDAWSRDGQWLYFSSTGGDIAGMNDVWRVRARGGQPAPVAADRYASEYWASPSPDGKALAITARGTVSGQWWRHGHSHLDESELWLVRDLDATKPTYERLGDAGGGKDAWPQWSPDGNSVYYMSDRSGEENLWVRLVNVADAKPRQLTHFTNGRVLWPSLAADGSALVFERNFGVWRYDVRKGEASAVPITLRGAIADASSEHLTLTQGFQSLALAPDGRKVAFLAHGDVFVAASRDGGDALRITQTADAETDPVWLPDSRRLVYASSRDDAWHLYLYDVTSRTERALTSGVGRDFGARVSPDGKWIAYRRNGHELRVVNADGSADHKLADGDFGEPPFANANEITWAPDSRWVAFLTTTERGFTNAYVVPTEGGVARPVSFTANSNGSSIAWSPDGTYLLFLSGQRTETAQLIRVDLVPRTPRFREDQFRDLFAPASPPASPPAAPSVQPARDSAARTATDSTRRDSSRANNRDANRAARPVSITFDDIRLRASLLNTQLEVGGLAISPDGRTLLLSAAAGGQQQLYSWSLDDLARDAPSARPLTTSVAFKGSAQWSPDSREVWYLEGGRVTAMPVDSRQARTVAITAELDVDFNVEKRAVFRQAWSYLATNFFDETMHGVNWRTLGNTIEPYVAGSRNPDDLRRVLTLMVGELNASHLGVNGPGGGAAQPAVGHLGIFVDRHLLEGNGAFTVQEVVAQGPAAIAGLKVGETITAVEGVRLTVGTSLDSLLAGKSGRRVALTVASAAGATREVALRPVSLAIVKGLLYRQWVEERRAYVARVSNNRLGYVHMFDMGQGSLDQLYLDLDAENHGREGVVVDVRNNNGGFVNAYALDVFTRRGYLQFTSRGSVTAPARLQLGQRALERPTVLVTNQHSLSDAEDFTEGYRALGLGKVVGEPTAGWIIYTSNPTLVDGTVLRIPSTRVRDAQGKDMELHPRPVDVNVIRPIGESYGGHDSQLDAAVRTLLEQLGATRR